MSKLAHTEDGWSSFSNPEGDVPFLELATLQCKHCGGHFFKKPGSLIKSFLTTDEAKRREAEGKSVRGWCQNCNGPICGPSCAECVPADLYLTNLEKGRNPEFKPICAAVPHNFKK